VLIALLQLAIGLTILYAGGHYLVRGATSIALLARVSVTVVALTVVAMGTSLPELAVSFTAAWRGSTDIAYSNVIGSSVFNIGAILGVAALIAVIPVQRQTIRVEYPIMLIASIVVLLLARDGVVDRVEAVALVVGIALFVSYTVYLARRGVPTATEEMSLDREVKRAAHLKQGAGRAWSINIGLVLVGFAALAGGAYLAVAGAVAGAEIIGVEERIIGLTVIAMGTSLPELATCVAATRQNEPDVALGNVIGSNIFNLLAILGITASVFPVPVHERSLALDNWVLLAFTLALFPMMWLGKRRISRFDGVLLLTGFVAYMSYVVVTR
jgi:cation:H+ antiporter